MHYAYFLSALAAGTMAMPGRTVHARDAPSPTDSAVASTSSALVFPTGWDKVDFNHLIKAYEEEAVSQASPASVANTTSHLNHWNVAISMMECYYDVSDKASCEANVVKPIMKYIKLGIDESRKFYRKFNEKHVKQVKEWRSEAVEFVKSFTHEDISFIKGTNYTSIAKKSIKLWRSSSFEMSDIASTGLSFASGVYAASKSSAIKVFQTEVKDTASLRKAFGEIWTIVKEKGTQGLAATAVNVAWELDSVIIAKASKNINDQKPADIDLSILNKDARTCDKEGTCYFFLKAQKIENVKNNKWEAVKGLDKINQYKVTSMEFAKAAVWFQSQFGGHAAKPNGTELLQSLHAKEPRPSLGYYASAPVVNLDKAHSLNADKIVKSKDGKASSEETLLSLVAHEVSTIKDWPYAKMWA